MVQRGYSLTLEDQEVLPHRKESHICSSIMAHEFSIWNVKEWSYEMIGALSQRPTTLSLGSMYLLMDYSKRGMYHFTFHTTMGRISWEGSSMDLIISLLIIHVKSFVFVLIDHLTKYLQVYIWASGYF